MAGKQIGTGIHRNYKMANWVAYQRRHLSTTEFNEWLQENVAARMYLERQAHLTKPERELERIFNDIGRKCILPSLQEASDFLAAIEKGNTPSATGTLRQSIGSTKAKWYGASFCGWVASGPRRGYGRAVQIVVTPKGKIKLKRLSNKASQFIAPARRKQPASYAYFLEHGHKGVKPTKKAALLIAARGFVGLRARTKDAAPHDFMESARSQSDQAASKVAAGINERLQTQLTD
jgi:hypothetical protein